VNTTPQGLQSVADLLSASGLSVNDLETFADKIAFDDNPYREYVVNINTAPAEVLALVPGMDRTLLNAILSYRQNGKAFQSLGDLLTLSGVTTQELQQAAAHLTIKSAVYLVRILVRSAGQPGLYAVEALVEMTGQGPRVLQWREAQHTPGWAAWVAPPNLPMPTAAGANPPPTSSQNTNH
jgi:type II secretory pathway component PulK